MSTFGRVRGNRIDDDEHGPDLSDGRLELWQIAGEIQPAGRAVDRTDGGQDVNLRIIRARRIEPRRDRVRQSVLGRQQQHRSERCPSVVRPLVATTAPGRHVEQHRALAFARLAADDTELAASEPAWTTPTAPARV